MRQFVSACVCVALWFGCVLVLIRSMEDDDAAIAPICLLANLFVHVVVAKVWCNNVCYFARMRECAPCLKGVELNEKGLRRYQNAHGSVEPFVCHRGPSRWLMFHIRVGGAPLTMSTSNHQFVPR